MKDALILIPAAGFGRRMGAPEAKEMLPRPGYKHMIDFSLDMAAQLGVPAHVIVREEKQTLIQHLRSRSGVSIQIVGQTREWPDTLLASEPFWRAQNVVVLPDTDFSPRSTLQQMLSSPAQSTWATFAVSDLKSWGALDLPSLTHAEKPHAWPATARAWGAFGFRHDYGYALLSQLLRSTMSGGEWLKLTGEVASFELENFIDFGR